MRQGRIWALVCSVGLTGMASLAMADDWPQWMGPKRDNIWRESGILDKFPAGGPKVLWKVPAAGGYAGPAVAQGKVFSTDFETKAVDDGQGNFQRKPSEGKERLLCYDEATGKELWKHEYPVTYTVSYPAGPRCTPTVDGDKVYFLGAEGHLFCLEVKSGKVLWSKELKKEYSTKSALWGYAGHPLIDGDLLILAAAAGSNNPHMVAFDKNTGKEIWKSRTAPEQGYSPAMITEAAGVRQLIVMAPNAISSLDPKTGKEYWSLPYKADNGSIIMTPIRFQDYIFVGGYQGKNLLVKLDTTKPGATVVWQDEFKLGISPVNVQPILVDNTLYGFHQDGEMFAVELPSGKRLWATPEPVSERKLGTGTAFIYKHEDKYFFFVETGHLVIGKLTPQGFTEVDRTKLLEPTGLAFGRKVLWNAPAFANKHMYVKNDKELICVDLSK